jgi:hypothetical protein
MTEREYAEATSMGAATLVISLKNNAMRKRVQIGVKSLLLNK